MFADLHWSHLRRDHDGHHGDARDDGRHGDAHDDGRHGDARDDVRRGDPRDGQRRGVVGRFRCRNVEHEFHLW